MHCPPDASHGGGGEHVQYAPYGRHWARGSTYNPLMYAGAYAEPLGPGRQHYLTGARYQDSGTGRFTQPDPLPSSVYEANRYAFAAGDPVNFTDKSGLTVDNPNNSGHQTSVSPSTSSGGGNAGPGSAGSGAVKIRNISDLPRNARLVQGKQAPDDIYRYLEQHHGISEAVANKRLHIIKAENGLGTADNALFDRTGGMWNPYTGDFMGSITDSALPTP